MDRPNSALDNILGHVFKVLDHGFIRPIDYMGNDSAIVKAARVSYGTGTKSIREDEGLIRYLWKNKHTSPFEMLEIKLHCKMPIFVARQWVRHRTANINEYSGRYSVMTSDFYIPERFGSQDTKNRQGTAEPLSSELNIMLQEGITEHCRTSYRLYKELLETGCSREQARMVLPVNFYTEWYWKIDLHNLLHFLTLRSDSHAQFEIREYSKAIEVVVKKWVPVVYSVWEEGLDRDNEVAIS